MPFGDTWKNCLYKCGVVWILLTLIWFFICYFETRRTKVAYVKWEHRNMANMPVLVRGVVCNSLWWGAFEELLWLKRCCLIHRAGRATASDCIFPFTFLLLPPLHHCSAFSFHEGGSLQRKTSWQQKKSSWTLKIKLKNMLQKCTGKGEIIALGALFLLWTVAAGQLHCKGLCVCILWRVGNYKLKIIQCTIYIISC